MKTSELRKHFDDRGSLFENTLPQIMNNSKHFFVSKSKTGVIRGYHYHERKEEWFCVLEGKARIVLKDIETNKIEEIVVDAKEGKVVFIPSNMAHAIENIGDGEMIFIAFVNEIFDHNNPDTFEYKVI